MKKNANGILPAVAIALTVIMLGLTVLMFVKSHIFWGIVFCLIAIDFAADAVLSFKKVS
jgi:hypothetical protein